MKLKFRHENWLNLIAKNLHYFGLIVVAFLMIQANIRTQISGRMLEESVKQQETLRNVLWVNLLTQRATVLALSRLVTNDRSNTDKSIELTKSIPVFLQSTNAGTPQASDLQNKVANIQSIFQQLHGHPSWNSTELQDKFLKPIEKIGTDLNEAESENWYELLDQNEHLVKDLRSRRMDEYLTYALFIFYLGFMGWLSARKNRADFLLKNSEMQAEKLRLEKEAAEEASNAKSMFLANMSHELRTPMHGILSFARFGQQKIHTAPQAKLKSYFDEIYESGSRLMSLLNDLLDLSKMEAGRIDYRMKEGDLFQIADAICSEMKAFAVEKQVTLQALAHTTNATAVFDSSRMMQVLRNLVSNAIKFSFKGTIIRIEFTESGDKLRCCILNRGVGIPESELGSIFDKFVQSSKTRTGAGGTGLGLSICKEIVQHHAGRIWAESKLNDHTKFIFEIPSSSGSTQKVA